MESSLSFAVCFSRRFKGLEAKPLPLWALDPFIYMYLKGVKPIEEPAKQEQSSIRLPKQTAKERLTAFWGISATNP